jgi:two-component system cell cycle response regulator CpdR
MSLPPPLRTLFVEDHDDVRELVGLMLEDEGLQVEACASAEAALTCFQQGAFDLLVTDISLPGQSGVDLARQLLAIKPDLWVLFLSGYPTGPALRALGPGVRSLLKPFEIDDLSRVLREMRGAMN